MDQRIADRIGQLKMEILALASEKKSGKTDAWKKCMEDAKKSLETVLYNYVKNGCDDGHYLGRYPELVTMYDPESRELLDEKIRVLGRIARNPEGPYKAIPGFKDILEKKAPEGVEEITFID